MHYFRAGKLKIFDQTRKQRIFKFLINLILQSLLCNNSYNISLKKTHVISHRFKITARWKSSNKRDLSQYCVPKELGKAVKWTYRPNYTLRICIEKWCLNKSRNRCYTVLIASSQIAVMVNTPRVPFLKHIAKYNQSDSYLVVTLDMWNPFPGGWVEQT